MSAPLASDGKAINSLKAGKSERLNLLNDKNPQSLSGESRNKN